MIVARVYPTANLNYSQVGPSRLFPGFQPGNKDPETLTATQVVA